MVGDKALGRPVIFEYSDYRSYLGDMFLHSKKVSKHFSHRSFAKRAGFHAPNFLKLVIDGKRNLTLESLAQVAQGFRLSASEKDYFSDLVFFCQATDQTKKAEFLDRMMRSRSFQKVRPLDAAQFGYYQKWYYIPVREMVALSDFRNDPEWIAERLGENVSAADVKTALQDLILLGLLKIDKNGDLRQIEASVNTANEVTSAAIVQYHKNMIQLGADSIEKTKPSHREVSAVCVAVSAETVNEIKSRIQKFREEILTLVNDDKSPQSIYQINFQLFPLTKDGQKVAK